MDALVDYPLDASVDAPLDAPYTILHLPFTHPCRLTMVIVLGVVAVVVIIHLSFWPLKKSGRPAGRPSCKTRRRRQKQSSGRSGQPLAPPVRVSGRGWHDIVVGGGVVAERKERGGKRENIRGRADDDERRGDGEGDRLGVVETKKRGRVREGANREERGPGRAGMEGGGEGSGRRETRSC